VASTKGSAHETAFPDAPNRHSSFLLDGLASPAVTGAASPRLSQAAQANI
jgi:hypothetical protein